MDVTMTARPWWKGLGVAVVSTVACALSLLCAATPAFASSGGGGSQGGGNIPAGQTIPVVIWEDTGSYVNGELNPPQGWEQDSVTYFLNKMNAVMPKPLGGSAGDGVPHLTRYQEAAQEALDNARARAGNPGTAKARLVGVGYRYMLLSSGLHCGLVHGGTAQACLSRPGTTSELTSDGWDTVYGSEGTWRQHVWNQALADNPGSDYAIVCAAVADGEPPAFGTISLTKESAEPVEVTLGNDNYSLANATFKVYSDASCTQDTGVVLTTDSEGKARATIHQGTYYLKETTPSPGYKLYASPIKIDIQSSKTTEVTVPEPLQTTTFDLYKVLEGTDGVHGALLGASHLDGAVFEIKYWANTDGSGDPTRVWQFQTDETGSLGLEAGAGYVSGDPLYTSSTDGTVYYPLGYYTVQEIKAPEGCMLEGQTDPDDTSYEAPVHTYTPNTTVTADFEEPTKPVKFEINKVDADTETAQSQGDATLANVEFKVYNANDNPVVFNGKTYEPGDLVTTVTADDNGQITFDIPYGYYRVVESVAPDGYIKNPQSWTGLVSGDNSVLDWETGTVSQK